jgi:toxin-antitoxin system PIN domain toxin
VILPDVNVLVYAFRGEMRDHERYESWLADVLAGSEELALHDSVLAGFTRIVTNRRIFADPAPTATAMEFVGRVRGAKRARWLPSASETWNKVRDLVREDPGIRGPLVPDAHLAALALAHGCTLATADRGFARFPGLTYFDPARDRA